MPSTENNANEKDLQSNPTTTISTEELDGLFTKAALGQLTEEVLKAAIKNHGPLDTLRQNGKTLLHEAAFSVFAPIKMIDLLLANGADINAVTEGDVQQTPVQRAIEFKKGPVVEHLCKLGAKVDPAAVESLKNNLIQHPELIKTLEDAAKSKPAKAAQPVKLAPASILLSALMFLAGCSLVISGALTLAGILSVMSFGGTIAAIAIGALLILAPFILMAVHIKYAQANLNAVNGKINVIKGFHPYDPGQHSSYTIQPKFAQLNRYHWLLGLALGLPAALAAGMLAASAVNLFGAVSLMAPTLAIAIGAVGLGLLLTVLGMCVYLLYAKHRDQTKPIVDLDLTQQPPTFPAPTIQQERITKPNKLLQQQFTLDSANGAPEKKLAAGDSEKNLLPSQNKA